MPLSLSRTSAPSKEPVTTAEAKTHLRVDTNAEDSYIDALVTAAREHVEQVTRRALITQTWELSLDDFPDSIWFDEPFEPWIRHGEKPILIPRSPLQSITKIEYVDTDGTTQTLSASKYRVDSKSEPARVTEAEGEVWPTTDMVTNGVTVTFEAGYGDNPSDVPQSIRHAIKLLIGNWYEHREQSVVGGSFSELPRAVDALLAPYRVKL